MNKSLALKLLAVGSFICLIVVLFAAAPSIKKAYNNWKYDVQKADDATNYATLKTVEDTLRAYISSYEADRITWETNKALDSEEARQLAQAALTRANRTAAAYNQYYLKNSYVWKDSIPADIKTELPYLSESQ